jgi:hypothetical protein
LPALPRRPVTGKPAGATYSLQVRARAGNQLAGEWSAPVSHMST